MCGLLFANSGDISIEQFKQALRLMLHRGPDFSSVYEHGVHKLGHNRLAILDLGSRANQPFVSSSGDLVMIYNGEIYNYKELAKKYKIALQTNCDSELVIELFERIGWRMLNELNGMFAMVILNVKTDQLFAARDRLGIKPLYYTYGRKTDEVCFSSEISPILSLHQNNAIDEIGLRQYTLLRTFFRGHTLYKNIKMLSAGSYYLDGKINTYWSLPYEIGKKAPNDIELKELILSAINYRKIADVPIGSYLSGGLDSSIITCEAKVDDSWTIGFEIDNEFKWSKIAAQRFNTSHTCIEINPADYLQIAKEMIQKRKEPLSVPNEVLLYLMTQEVKNKNTVVLSGEGADELFFGYDRIFKWANQSSSFDIKEFTQHYAYGEHSDDEIVDYVMEPFIMPGYQPIDIVAHFFQVGHLHGLLRRLDNSTMYCSVEARVPFVDHRLVERLAGVPFQYKQKDGQVKAPLKKIFHDKIPIEIINRKKIGFPVPLSHIFCLKDQKRSTLFSHWLNYNLSILEVEIPQ